MAEAVLRSAERAHRRTGYHRVSVFAAEAVPGESAESLRARLLAAAELSGIDPHGNKRYYVCAKASTLRERGFTFQKSGYPGEASEHYDVDLGVKPDVDVAERFLEAFTSAEEWSR